MSSDGQTLLHPYRFKSSRFVYNDKIITIDDLTEQLGLLPPFCTTWWNRLPFVGQEFNGTSHTFSRNGVVRDIGIGSDNKLTGRNLQLRDHHNVYLDLRTDLKMRGSSFFREVDRFVIFFRVNQSIIYCEEYEVCIQ